MSDEQRSGMEPEAAVRGRLFSEDTVPGPEPADDTEGHARGLKAKDDEQAGSETGTESEGLARPGRYADDADIEGHGVKLRP